jgi:hypothetical protein
MSIFDLFFKLDVFLFGIIFIWNTGYLVFSGDLVVG